MLSSALPGNASVQEQPEANGLTTSGLPSITARFTQTSLESESLGTQLKTQGASDSLLAAVVSLEASTSSEEVRQSMERIQSLALPQQSPPVGELTELAEGTSEAETDPAEAEGLEQTEPACVDTGSPAYCVYTVVQGDTLSGIASQLGFAGNGSLSAAEMLAQSNRPDVQSTDHIEPGQSIRVPRETGIVHTVLFAESASEIAADYGISLDALLSSPYNAFGADNVVAIGQNVFVPSPTQLPVNEEVELTLDEPTPEATEPAIEEPTEAPTEAPTAEPTATETVSAPEPTTGGSEIIPQLGALNTPTPEPTSTPEPTETPEETATPEATEPADATATPAATRQPSSGGGSGLFIWPTQGPISSYFGPSHPLGIDIDLFATPNADIVASRAGEVVFAGGDPCCSYGYYVIVDHGNGVQTLYAHLSRIRVSQGEFVDQGDLLGYGGNTGNSTGNHLHFEIRVNGNVVDPLRYLP